MLLCIDIGNTNIKLGVFNGDALSYTWRISTDRSNLRDEYAMLILSLFQTEGVKVSDISGCAISSVVPPLTQEFVEFCQHYLGLEPVLLRPDTVTGIRINTDIPGEVGSDLVMNALGAKQLFSGPMIIVGMGTATTFTAISAAGDLEGVAIAPGLLASANSLVSSTSTLPRVALAQPKTAIGKNTIASLQAGLVWGFAALVEGLVKRMQVELGGHATVIATGGLANVVIPETGIIQAVEPNLVLLGLKAMYELNQKSARG
ncbi:MAG TPA: type III pantothenate kinase [Anaerolineaceae bacterium]|nr:type III pantothenate kinase [Anaerolineaceae bacterium]HPN53968.1 type III pantothenate kinase [Anaerolineaceae bacterium]